MQAALLVLAGFALVTALLGWTRWRAGRRWAAAGNLLLSSLAATTVSVTWPAAGQLATFEPRVAAATIAELRVEQAGPQQFRVTLTRLPAGRMQVFHVDGAEWRLHVTTLDWSGHAREFGPSPGYRLMRLESRRQPEPADGPGDPGSAYALDDGRTRDPWPQAWRGPAWAQVIRLRDLSSPWLPLADGARFAARLRATGLEVTTQEGSASEDLGAR